MVSEWSVVGESSETGPKWSGRRSFGRPTTERVSNPRQKGVQSTAEMIVILSEMDVASPPSATVVIRLPLNDDKFPSVQPRISALPHNPTLFDVQCEVVQWAI